MADIPQNGSERLDSWKAIAAYLQRDERTVRRWEREQGLPVRRVPGGRGTSVFAYVSEIEAWLKAAAGSDPALSPPPTPVPRFKPRIVSVAAASLLLAAAVIWMVVESIAADNSPVSAKITASGIVALNAEGIEQWRYPFPSDEKVFLPDEWRAEVWGGRTPAILAATALRLRGANEVVSNGELLWLTARGKLERRFSFNDQLTFGAGAYGTPWGITAFRVNERDGRRRIATSAHHDVWWPSMVTILDDDWRRQGTFVNAGWIEWVNWVSPDRLVVSGFSQEQDGGMVALLDVNALNGQSPSAPDSPFYCTSCGDARPLRYIVMPRSELNRATASRFNRARVYQSGDSLQVRTIEVPQEEGAVDVLYEFTPSLDLVRASFSDRYWELHRSLEAQGKLNHSRAQCPDRAGPREIRAWELATGWRTIRTQPG